MSPSAERPFEGRLEAVTFDCWNTLLYEENWPAAHARRVAELQRVAAEAGHTTTREEATRAFDSAWSQHMDLWREEQATGAVDRWSLEILGIAPHGIAFDRVVHHWQRASHTHVEVLAGSRRLLPGSAALASARRSFATPGSHRAAWCGGIWSGRASSSSWRCRSSPTKWASRSPTRGSSTPPSSRCASRPSAACTWATFAAPTWRAAVACALGTVRLRARFDDLEALPEADRVEIRLIPTSTCCIPLNGWRHRNTLGARHCSVWGGLSTRWFWVRVPGGPPVESRSCIDSSESLSG